MTLRDGRRPHRHFKMRISRKTRLRCHHLGTCSTVTHIITFLNNSHVVFLNWKGNGTSLKPSGNVPRREGKQREVLPVLIELVITLYIVILHIHPIRPQCKLCIHALVTLPSLSEHSHTFLISFLTSGYFYLVCRAKNMLEPCNAARYFI